MKGLLALLGAVLVATSGCNREASAGDIVRIGLAGPMEASYGISVREGAELAVEEANARGGIDGRRIELFVQDDRGDEARAIQVATLLANDPSILAVVGHVNSGTSRAAARIYNDESNPLLELSPTATSAELSGAGRWTFRVCPTDLRHGPALAAWARRGLGRSRAAVLYANDAYGRGMLESFASAFSNDGGVIVATDPYLPQLVDSMALLRPYLERAVTRGADIVMIAGELDVALPALRELRGMGFTGPLVGGDGLLGMEEEAPDARAVYISTGFLPDQPGTAAQRFVQAYQQRYGAPPTGDAALAYDAVNVVLHAIAQGATTRRAVRDFVAGIGTESATFAGVTGAIEFDENGDAVDKEVTVGTISAGRLVSARAAGS